MMKKKIFKSTLAVVMLAVAGYGGYKAYAKYASNEMTTSLLMQNVEALTQKESQTPNTSYKYPNKEGEAKFCNLYIYMKGGVQVHIGTEKNSQYEADSDYTCVTRNGLKDNCPNSGSGCNPYSCQEVPYTPY